MSAAVDWRTLRAARANRVFCADEKRIRAEDPVIDKSRQGLGFVVRATADRANPPVLIGAEQAVYRLQVFLGQRTRRGFELEPVQERVVARL